MLDTKTGLGIIATLIAILAFIPYFRDIALSKTKPHAFSWLIWGLLMLIAYSAQVTGHAGPGAWVTGISAAICLSIFFLALKRGEKSITRFDKGCLIFALAAIPVWATTKTPLWSVIMVSIIDAVGFLPTFRKAYARPFEETRVTFTLSAMKFIVALFAFDEYSLTTLLYPSTLIFTNISFVMLLTIRRKAVTASMKTQA